jgi:myo-inositol-1(or 4)-monophosphatase
MTSTNALMTTLKKALTEAGGIIRRCADRGVTVSHKGRVDVVTNADHAAERRIVAIVRRAFPEHGWLMEEGGERRSSSPYRWVVDPLDGTVNFSHGLPVCCVSIGVEKDGRVEVGGVFDPFRDELFLARRGRGATLNGRRIRVSATSKLIDALLATGFPYDRYKKAAFYLSFIQKFMERAQGIRRLGAAALDLAQVACGRYDGYWEFNLKPWDAAAGRLLVEEAGGRLSDFRGRPYTLSDTRQTLASNGRLHPALLRILKTDKN